MDIENNNVYKHGNKTFDMYQDVVRPMLRVGHEGELITWMKETGLLRSGVRCQTPDCQARWLNWTNARIVDKYSWVCPTCMSKVSIREGSFFVKFKCGLKITMQAIMAWCNQTPMDVACQSIEGSVMLKQHVIRRVYERCSETASCYVLEHWQEWCLGGPNTVVLIDVFPDGYMASEVKKEEKKTPLKKKAPQRILCLADLNSLPPRAWLQIVKPQHADQSTKSSGGLVDDALLLVRRHVLPGTALVANYKAKCCSMEAVRQLEGYASTTSVETLMELDRPGSRRLLENLETIWKSVAGVCEDVQSGNERESTISLHEFMWRQSFAQTPALAFDNILHHITEQYSFKH